MATDVTYGSNIDLAGNELRNARAHVLTAAPTGTAGKFYYNSTDNKLYWHNGSTWVSAGGADLANLSGQAAAFGQSAANGTASTAARSDHYHALPAHDAAAHSSIKLSDLAMPSVNVAMAGFKLTGLGPGSVNGDSLRYEQVYGQFLPLSGGTLTGNLTLNNVFMQVNGGSGTMPLYVRGMTNTVTTTDILSMAPALNDHGGFKITVYADGDPDTNAVAFTTRDSGNGTGPALYFRALSLMISRRLDMNTQRITNMADATAATDAVTKQQLDTKANTTHSHAISDVTSLQTTLDAKAPLASPALTGTPTAPTAAAGTNNTQIATTAFVQAAVAASAAGLDVKASVRAATTGNVDLATGMGLATIDGVSVAVGERVLVKNQTNPAENGIYTRAAGTTGNMYASDADTSAEVNAGMFVFVEEGTTQADTGWVLTTNNPITLGTTGLTFTQFSGPGAFTWGNGLSNTGSTINVGAGTGITVGADTVGIDTAVVARKYSTAIGGIGPYVVTHNLNTRAVVVSIVQEDPPYGQVMLAWEATSVNSITVYNALGSLNPYELRVTVIG